MTTYRRSPRPQYKGKNGFIEPILNDVEEPNAVPVVPGANGVANAPKAQRERTMRHLVAKHRLVEDMLEIKGSYFPG